MMSKKPIYLYRKSLILALMKQLGKTNISTKELDVFLKYLSARLRPTEYLLADSVTDQELERFATYNKGFSYFPHASGGFPYSELFYNEPIESDSIDLSDDVMKIISQF